ncbi:MAG: hypothetical protein EA369_09760 [Bradymonadales bacterium]|nr:MAG: hypothetical protein EA369_09760 [Bradymonadales bacterium]
MKKGEESYRAAGAGSFFFSLRHLIPGLLIFGLLGACGQSVNLPFGGGNIDTDGFSDSQKAFVQSNTFQTVVNHCSACHANLNTPFFAIPNDPEGSHDNLIAAGAVDLSDPRESRIVSRVYLNHNCWTASCQNDGDFLLARITAWSDQIGGGGSSNGPSGIVTEPVTIPASLATVAETETLEFNLVGITPGLPAPLSLRLEISRFDEDAYQISNPRLFSGQEIIVQGISIFLNASSSPVDAPAFSAIDASISANLVDGTIIQNDGDAAPVALFQVGSEGPGGDSLQLRFDGIGSLENIRQQKFDVMVGLIGGQCSSCHTGNPMPPLPSTPFGGNIDDFTSFNDPSQFIDENYGRALVVPGDPLASGLYRAVASGVDGNGIFPEYAAGGIAEGSKMAEEFAQNPNPDLGVAKAIREWIELLEP